MSELLIRVLKAKEVYSSGSDTFSVAPEKFFLVGDVWIAIMEGSPLGARSYNHVAFQITEEDVDERLATIRELGLEVKSPRSRVDGEGRSIYFYDHDNHLFELHTGSLEMRLRTYATVSPKRS